MCKSFETGVCKFGTGCNFAHGLADLRSPPRGGIGKPPQPPPRPPMNGVGPMASGMPGSTLQNGKFKTVMCEKITSQVNICSISSHEYSTNINITIGFKKMPAITKSFLWDFLHQSCS